MTVSNKIRTGAKGASGPDLLEAFIAVYERKIIAEQAAARRMRAKALDNDQPTHGWEQQERRCEVARQVLADMASLIRSPNWMRQVYDAMTELGRRTGNRGHE